MVVPIMYDHDIARLFYGFKTVSHGICLSRPPITSFMSLLKR
jgi:hypothetical protein